VRGKRRRAERRLEQALDARMPRAASSLVALEAISAGSHVEIDAGSGTVRLVREPVGPPCSWCGLPVEQRRDGSQSRCGCGLP
jgi:hypothetical protein